MGLRIVCTECHRIFGFRESEYCELCSQWFCGDCVVDDIKHPCAEEDDEDVDDEHEG